MLWHATAHADELYDLAEQAIERGVSIQHIFEVSNLLRFAEVADGFDVAKELVKRGVDVLIVERDAVANRVGTDFSVFSRRDRAALAVRASADTLWSDLQGIKLITCHDEVAALQDAWRAASSVPAVAQLVRI